MPGDDGRERAMIPENRERFPDLHPSMDSQSAVAEANRCLYCFDAPCTAACPTHIDVPRFIKKIASGNLRGSAATILDANILGLSCSRACPVEVLCEGACVMLRYNKKPIEIGRLQRYAMEKGAAAVKMPVASQSDGGSLRVACIGGGPASLSCAAELRKHGVSVTVFDNRPLPGGLNTYGVAEYKLRVEDSLKEIERIRAMGVEFRCADVGRSITLEEIEKEFDYIFLGVGLGGTERLGIHGENFVGVVDALQFIAQYKTRPGIRVEGSVAVIGGGNTAIDAANAAVRLGAAEVHLYYRRSEKEMPAFAKEYEHSKVEGVKFHFNAIPLSFTGCDGKVAGVMFAEAVAGQPGPDGRRAVMPRPGSDYHVACDLVVLAVGQSRLMADRKVADRATGRTADPRYYAGGDFVNGGREVVDAVADGKRAALGILEASRG